jgi:phage terminase small subunit
MQVSADRVIAELSAVAFSNITKVMSWGGGEGPAGGDAAADPEAETAQGDAGERYDFRLRKSAMLDPRTAAAVAEFRRYSHGAVRVRMHDKLPALMLLGRHLGLFGPGAMTLPELKAQQRQAEQEDFYERLKSLPREKRDELRRAMRGAVAEVLGE